MDNKPDPLHQLSEIKNMMEKSSRFLSLSGLSGVSAGMVALVGAFLAYRLIGQAPLVETDTSTIEIKNAIGTDLFLIALGTLGLAILLIFLFTYRKSQKLKLPVWTSATRRLIYHLAVPLLTGGLFLLKIVDMGYWGLIAPGCLLFYGLSLVNASRYTIGDIGVLGMIEIGLGLLNLLFIGQGLLFWTLGFGLAHIVYGVYMWNKYDKN
jgi:hypothetical protein